MLLGIGVSESTKLNNVFTALNLVTVIIVVIAGAVKSECLFYTLYKLFARGFVCVWSPNGSRLLSVVPIPE